MTSRINVVYYVKLALRLVLTLSLLFYVISLISINDLIPIIQNLDFKLVILALTFHIIAFFLMSVRWWFLLVANRQKIKYSKIFPAYYLGLFCNNFLPTAIGGDVIRIAKLKSEGLNIGPLIFSTLFDRIIGLLSIVLMGIIGINLSASISSLIGNNAIQAINIISILAILLFLLLLVSKLRYTIINSSLVNSINISKLNNLLAYFHDNVEMIKTYRILSTAILLSIVSQLLIVFTYFSITKSLQIELTLLDFLLIVPVVSLLSSLPISVGGLGVREGTLVILISATGIQTTMAVQISLVYLTILIISTIPGGIVLLFRKKDLDDHFSTADQDPLYRTTER